MTITLPAPVARPRAGAGLLVRLQDLSGQGGTVRLPHPAVLCTADERDLQTLSDGVVELGPWQVMTLKMASQDLERSFTILVSP